MIHLEQVTARAAPIALGPVTLRFEAGISAVLGTRADGVSLLLDVLAARVPVKSGRAQLLERAPGTPE
ncbi:MAG TPA: hypothetical protein VNO21_16115, partial [Polyangiaceae bacterium]|nr:hypothetical protein [Polyangiaceae bacterium]